MLNFQTDTSINRHLSSIFARGDAVVFAGAGISLEPPAGLPDWHKLRDFTLEAIASREKILAEHVPLLTEIDMIAIPGKKGLTPEYVASQIVNNCGTRYYECFRVLEEGSPNANHRYLAQMARSGHIRHFVTTNFDRFLEKAFEKEGIPYIVHRSDMEFSRFLEREDPSVHVFKLHGCIGLPDTVTATVEQEGKGLSSPRKKVLERLLLRHHFVFWGYSGADLKIDLDYLGMVTQKDMAKGFVWNFLLQGNEQEPVNPWVQKLADLYGPKAHIVHGKLPEIFDSLIAPKDRIERTVYSWDEEKKWRERKNQELKKALFSWAEKNVRHDHACNIFAQLLRQSGQMTPAVLCLQRWSEVAKMEGRTLSYANAQNNRGLFYQALGEYDKALGFFEEAEKLYRSEKSMNELSVVTNNLGLIYKLKGDHEKGLAFYRESERMCRSRGDQKGIATSLSNLGLIHETRGEYDEALDCYQKAEAIALSLGNKQGLSTYRSNLGLLYRTMGRYEEAFASFKQAEAIDRTLGDKPSLAVSLNNIGLVHKQKQEYDKAISCYAEAQSIAMEVDDRKTLAAVFNNIAMIHDERGEIEKAISFYAQAEQLARSMGELENLGTYLGNLGLCYKSSGQLQKALDCFNESLEIANKIGKKSAMAIRINSIGLLHKDRKEYDKALDHFKKALAVAESIADQSTLAAANNSIGLIHYLQRNYETSLSHYRAALSAFESLGDIPSAAVTAWNLGLSYECLKMYPQARECHQKSVLHYQKIGRPEKSRDIQKRIEALQNL